MSSRADETPVIEASTLGKQYRFVQRRDTHDTLRDEIVAGARAAWARLGRAPGARGRRRDGNQFWALRDDSFSCRRGEVVGVIGRNGSGKSTLLKVLAGITEPTEGYADLRGRVGALLEVGTGFHPELSGRENIFLSGAILGMRKDEIVTRFDEIVSFAGVGDFIDTPVKHYSSGMHLRLAFAVASHLEPEILLVDEVLAVGDAEFQKKCLGRMDEVASDGRTVLFVSHNLAAISRLCTRGLLLEKGCVLAQGPIRSVLERYASELRQRSETETEPDGGGLAIRSLGVGGSVAPELASGEGFRADYRVNLSSSFDRVRLILTVRDAEEQVVVYASAQSGEPGVPSSAGLHDLGVRVPPLWLAPGAYGIQLKVVGELEGRKRTALSEPMLLTVEADHARDLSAPGCVKPRCEWTVASRGA
jgi:lipopolysaccharide transport system ATP-binding protein